MQAPTAPRQTNLGSETRGASRAAVLDPKPTGEPGFYFSQYRSLIRPTVRHTLAMSPKTDMPAQILTLLVAMSLTLPVCMRRAVHSPSGRVSGGNIETRYTSVSYRHGGMRSGLTRLHQ